MKKYLYFSTLALLAACGGPFVFVEDPPQATVAPAGSDSALSHQALLAKKVAQFGEDVKKPLPTAPPEPEPTDVPDREVLEAIFANPLIARSAVPEPTPSPRDVATRETTTVNGSVYDDMGVLVTGYTLTVSNQSRSYHQTFQSDNGRYVLNQVPGGEVLDFRVEKERCRTVTQRIVVKSNTPGNPDANVIDFGGPKAPNFFLTDSPMVIRISPEFDKPFTAAERYSLSLFFEQPVRRGDVEQGLRLTSRAALATPVPLLGGAGENLSGFTFQWNNTNDSVTVTFWVPVGRGLSSTTEYNLTFQVPLQSLQGSQHPAKSPFFLKGAIRPEVVLRFEGEEKAPTMIGYERDQSSILVKFSERMSWTKPDGSTAQSVGLAVLDNYTLEADKERDGLYETALKPLSLKVEEKTVRLQFADLTPFAGQRGRLKVNAAPDFTDLAGNVLTQPLPASFDL